MDAGTIPPSWPLRCQMSGTVPPVHRPFDMARKTIMS